MQLVKAKKLGGIVAIVGRPNVGKSTLFNRLVGMRSAIVDDHSGVTRDRHYGSSDWNGHDFTVVDTGGYVEKAQDVFEEAIKKQVHMALNEADIVLFMVDAKTGITAEDDAFARLLRGIQKPVMMVANKCDTQQDVYAASEFYALGFDEMFTTASVSGAGNGELLDRVVEELRNMPTNDEGIEEGVPKFCVIGKPNVGKSTFVNVLLDEERNIVADIPGTTRDPTYTLYNKFNKKFYLIDTAGLRKRKAVHEDLEFYSVMRAIKALEDSDVAFMMIDAIEGISSQDLTIIGLATKRKKGLVILVNKWDLREKATNTMRDEMQSIKTRMAPFTDVPILFVSAKDKVRIHQALEMGLTVFENRAKKIATAKLNEWLKATLAQHPVPSYGGRAVKINYVTQIPTPTPVFAFFSNMPLYIKESYRRYLENQLRQNFGFSGVPLRLVFKKK